MPVMNPALLKPNPKKHYSEYQSGDTWLQSVAEILADWDSIDMQCLVWGFSDRTVGQKTFNGWSRKQKWNALFREKRDDYQYPDLLRSLRRHGFLTYLGASINGTAPGVPSFGNGNHRLAAAVELGYKYVPLRAHTYWSEDGIERRRGPKTSVWLEHTAKTLPKLAIDLDARRL